MRRQRIKVKIFKWRYNLTRLDEWEHIQRHGDATQGDINDNNGNRRWKTEIQQIKEIGKKTKKWRRP